MMLTVNGTPVPPDAIAREMALHADVPDPEAAARRTLAIRELMLQRAGELGLLENGLPRERVSFAGRDEEDAVIAQLLESEVTTPQPTPEECRRYYETHPERFTSGDLVEARHILFAIMPGTPVMALREHAERVLAELKAAPETFAARAQELSNCPSGQHGGNLGQFGRGEMVPEFDQAIFGTAGHRRAADARRHALRLPHRRRRAPDPRQAAAVRGRRRADRRSSSPPASRSAR